MATLLIVSFRVHDVICNNILALAGVVRHSTTK